MLIGLACNRIELNNSCCNKRYKIVKGKLNKDISETLYIPGLFTPNEDNINDVFRPRGMGWVTKSLIIYNNFNKIYEIKGNGILWDGKNKKDKTYNEGQYKYKLVITKNKDLSEVEIEGFICLYTYKNKFKNYCNCTQNSMIDDQSGFIYPGDEICN